jgi:hypothetical protein
MEELVKRESIHGSKQADANSSCNEEGVIGFVLKRIAEERKNINVFTTTRVWMWKGSSDLGNNQTKLSWEYGLIEN